MYWKNGKGCKLQAHRGVASDAPENTMAAFREAVRQGYDTIELDPECTKDGQFVVLHDGKLNRTGRNPDGTAIETELRMADLTLAEAQRYDYGLWFGERFRGEKLPLLEDALRLSQESGIPIKIDNKIERCIPEDRKEAFYALLERYETCIGLTSARPETIRFYAERFPKAGLHYDGRISEEILRDLGAYGERLTVWVPHQNRLTTWVRIPFADEALCGLVKRYAKLGIWIVENDEAGQEVLERFGPEIVETTGGIKPCAAN